MIKSFYLSFYTGSAERRIPKIHFKTVPLLIKVSNHSDDARRRPTPRQIHDAFKRSLQPRVCGGRQCLWLKCFLIGLLQTLPHSSATLPHLVQEGDHDGPGKTSLPRISFIRQPVEQSDTKERSTRCSAENPWGTKTLTVATTMTVNSQRSGGGQRSFAQRRRTR